jgi:hypothetical protein
MQGCFLPPCAAPGQLHDDEEATAEAGIRRRRRNLGFGSGDARASKGDGSGGGVLGAAGGLNSPEGVPWRAGHAPKVCLRWTRAAAARDSAESGLDTARRRG